MAINDTQRGPASTRSGEAGFTLLVAVIFMSVMLNFGLALGSLAYKQQVLTSGAIASQYAFYVADTALECTLYADQQQDLFAYGKYDGKPKSMKCDGNTVAVIQDPPSVSQLISRVRLDLEEGTRCADVAIYKSSASSNMTYFFSQGYNTPCATVANPGQARFASRGLSVHYGTFVNGACATTHYGCMNGSLSINNVEGTDFFTWSCTGSGGGSTATCTEGKTAPTATLVASPMSVSYGERATLTWTSSYATACNTSLNWSNASPPEGHGDSFNGNGLTDPITTTTTFTFQCIGNGQNSSLQSVTVTVGNAPVDGSCGATPAHYFCASPASSIDQVLGGSAWTWTCPGSNGGIFASCTEARTGGTMSLTGYAWSSAIGWISFSGLAEDSSPYGVSENKTSGALSGYAWSPTVGWITFNASDGTHTAPQANLATGNVTGWARACAAFSNATACSGVLAGTWDGWISLSGVAGDSTPYGITQSPTCEWAGYAWGDDIISWVSLAGIADDNSSYGVTGDDPVVCTR